MLQLEHHVETRCQYTQRANGVHHFIFSESSQEAVDEWIHHLENLYAHSTPNTVLRILVDSCEISVQPLAYASQRAHELNQRYPLRPGTRTAFLYQTSFLASLARTFIIMLSRVGVDHVQFFPGTNREAEAVAWLLKPS